MICAILGTGSVDVRQIAGHRSEVVPILVDGPAQRSLMRPCRPGPMTRHRSRTSWSTRNEISSLVGVLCGPRGRTWSDTRPGSASATGTIRAKAPSEVSGLSGSAAMPWLITASSSSVGWTRSGFSIPLDLPSVGQAEADDANRGGLDAADQHAQPLSDRPDGDWAWLEGRTVMPGSSAGSILIHLAGGLDLEVDRQRRRCAPAVFRFTGMGGMRAGCLDRILRLSLN